jgi:imidazoleglycerol-phosphate dehydratase
MRTAQISRQTRETDITATLLLDGGSCEISTGIGFFDHMLTAFAVHGGFGLTLKAVGDLEVDAHHTVEDTGIVLGKAFAKALGDKSGIARYGSFYIPMDEALAMCVVDISGRPYLVFDDPFENQVIGSFDACLVTEFLRAFAFNAGITLHVNILYGSNAHHMAEAIFKALGHAMTVACTVTGSAALSTKGVL